MKIYDISQEVFSCKVFPGDPEPEKRILNSTDQGGLYNLTAFSMCAHNGTHIDVPFHFLGEGKTVEQMEEVLAELSEDPEMKALLVSVKEKLSRISDKDFEQLDLESYRDELEEEDEAEGTPEGAEGEEG